MLPSGDLTGAPRTIVERFGRQTVKLTQPDFPGLFSVQSNQDCLARDSVRAYYRGRYPVRGLCGLNLTVCPRL